MGSPQILFDGPTDSALTVALAHGAGAPMDSPFMDAFAEGLAARGYRAARFEFPYMIRRRETGTRRPPDRATVLLDTWRAGIREHSVAEGYPYADGEEMGMSFTAVADGDREAARQAAVWMARRAWDRRVELNVPVPGVTEALKMAVDRYVGPKPEGVTNFVPADGSALSAPVADSDHSHLGPIVLMDVGDNIGAGSSADSTFILAEAMRMGVKGLLQSLYDPEAVAACVEAGVGSEVTLDVGGKTDDMHGKPVRVTGVVRAISDGDFEETRPIHAGYRYFSAGTCVRPDTTDGNTPLLTAMRSGNTSRVQM